MCLQLGIYTYLMDSLVSLGDLVFQGWQKNYTLAPLGGFRVIGLYHLLPFALRCP